MVSFVVIDKLVEEFTWLKELCRMWDIPIKSAGLTMHCIDYIDHNNYREPSLGRSQKEKNSAPFPFNTDYLENIRLYTWWLARLTGGSME